MWIIVGLGNPGAAYAHTRHNIGFMVVETIAKRWRIALADPGAALRVGRGVIADRPVVLVEPQTFMNCSGDALAELPMNADDTILAIYDDLDLPIGRLRVRPRGRSAGHRGVASLADRFGEEFPRLRVGIGRPPMGQDAADYVLATLAPAERDTLRAGVERAGDAIETIVTDGIEIAMNRFNAPSPDTDDGVKES